MEHTRRRGYYVTCILRAVSGVAPRLRGGRARTRPVPRCGPEPLSSAAAAANAAVDVRAQGRLIAARVTFHTAVISRSRSRRAEKRVTGASTMMTPSSNSSFKEISGLFVPRKRFAGSSNLIPSYVERSFLISLIPSILALDQRRTFPSRRQTVDEYANLGLASGATAVNIDH